MLKLPYKVALTIIMTTLITACGGDKSAKYFEESSSIAFSVSVENIPDPQNNVLALLEDATVQNSDTIQGVWQGEFVFYLGGKPRPFSFFLTIKDQDGILRVQKHGAEGFYSDMDAVVFDAPMLTFEDNTFLSSPEGERIPLYADLVLINEGELKGVLKEVLTERGGIQFFSEYDVNMSKVH